MQNFNKKTFHVNKIHWKLLHVYITVLLRYKLESYKLICIRHLININAIRHYGRSFDVQ